MDFARSCARSRSVDYGITGRQSGTVNFPLESPSRASAVKVRTPTAFWDTMINPGVSCAQTLDTPPGTIRWIKICREQLVPHGSVCIWITLEDLYPFTLCLRQWSSSTDFRPRSLNRCTLGLELDHL